MIDIHCHLLWGMDDGAQSYEDTESLCRSALQNGIDTVVLTPHMTNLETVDDYLFYRDSNIAELKNALQALHLPLTIYAGAEVFLNDLVFTADGLHDLTLGGTSYLLCELPIQPFPREKGMLYVQEILDRRLIPVLAHPERYAVTYAHPHFLKELAAMGALFQVNAASLAGKYGKAVQSCALNLLQSGMADFLATDAHRPSWRPNHYQRYKALFPPEISEKRLQWATEIAPKLLLENRSIRTNRPDFL